jgi:hypothetical protein
VGKKRVSTIGDKPVLNSWLGFVQSSMHLSISIGLGISVQGKSFPKKGAGTRLVLHAPGCGGLSSPEHHHLLLAI